MQLEIAKHSGSEGKSVRPLIFACQCLGGLVVANELSRNYREPQDENIINLSFFPLGTLLGPLGGFDKAKYASLALSLVQ